MTTLEKQKIINMIKQGYSHKEIGDLLGLSRNTISSIARRSNGNLVEEAFCPYCGAPLKQTRGHRQKTYCSDNCRKQYWKKHRGSNNV